MKSTSNTLQQLVLRETDDGLRLVRFLVDVMDAEIEGVKTADRASAARELLDRCFGKPFTATDRSAETSDSAADASGMLIDRIMRVIGEVSEDGGEDVVDGLPLRLLGEVPSGEQEHDND